MQQTLLPLKLRRFSKTVEAKQWNRIRNQENKYPNLKSIKILILEKEKKIATNFSNVEKSLQKRKDIKVSQLEFDFEWFLTWRIKIMVYRTCLWCDGVEILELNQLNKYEYFLSSEIWLGPESNVKKEYKCKMNGTITINESSDKLLNYNFEIDYRNDRILVTK